LLTRRLRESGEITAMPIAAFSNALVNSIDYFKLDGRDSSEGPMFPLVSPVSVDD
jgi:hypothetical protein